jgi:hypothetical protein
MTIFTGKKILDRVRRKIKSDDYGSYEEINEAQSWIARKTSFNWLRKSNILGSGLVSDTKEYDLNLGSVRRITGIYIAKASSTDTTNAITGITLSGTDPVQITIVAHGLTTGRQGVFSSVGGTTELNDNTYKITKVDADNFTLQGTDSSNFTAWTSGGTFSSWDIDDGAWDLMIETPLDAFEQVVKTNTNLTSSVNTGTVVITTTEVESQKVLDVWSYKLMGGDSNPFMKMVVSPTPTTTYKIKINYIREVTEISEDTVPDIPVSYIDSLVFLAASFVLEMSDSEADRSLADRYFKKGSSMFNQLVNDSHANRAGGVDRPPAPWLM